MKLNKIFTAVTLTALYLCSSCVDLDKDPLGSAVAGKIENEKQALLRLVAVYSDMKDFRYTWSINAFGDVLSDDGTYSGSDNDAATFTLMEDYQYPADHSEILNKYAQTYQCINKANLVIRDFMNADDHLFSTHNREHMIAEAKFIRAHSYFELVKTFGGVPLYTSVLELDHQRLGRSSAEEVYAAIEKDLEEAAAILPAKSEVKDYLASYAGRITKGAVYAMQTRVYLYQKKYDKVKEAAHNLFNLNEYSLADDYGYQFLIAGEHCSESILEVNMYNSPTQSSWNVNNGNRHVLMSMPRNLTIGFGCAQPTAELAAAYDRAGDAVRKKATLLSTEEAIQIEEEAKGSVPAVTGDRTGFYNRKLYLKPGERVESRGNNQPLNHKLIRLAEVYLNYAEACALGSPKDETEAKKYLNMIRTRAKLPEINSTGDRLFEDIINERHLELALEGFRFFDVVRVGWGPKVFKNFKSGAELLPIPQVEIDISKGEIIQNPR
ncbi:MAG: RagB/SusD family nutrient uptake outer membrane protein [Tannerella sp.]|jgi:hypothetical protein|nr:RagB/SusD family nutrient uptake outer membrane protein [Tannerella sp.]